MSKAVFCAFDTETTGLDGNINEIISFAGVILDKDFKVLKHLEVHAHPEHMERFHPEAQAVNGYTKEAWDAKGAVNQDTLQRKIQDFLTGYKFLYPVGHNIRFDKDFIRPLIGPKFYDRVFSYHELDTVSIALFCDLAYHDQPHAFYSLKPLCMRFNIELTSEHDAKSDISATVNLFKYLMEVVRGNRTLPPPTPVEERYFMTKVALPKSGEEIFLFRYGAYKYQTVAQALERDGKEAARYLNQFVLKSTDITPEARDHIKQCLHDYQQNTV